MSSALAVSRLPVCAQPRAAYRRALVRLQRIAVEERGKLNATGAYMLALCLRALRREAESP